MSKICVPLAVHVAILFFRHLVEIETMKLQIQTHDEWWVALVYLEASTALHNNQYEKKKNGIADYYLRCLSFITEDRYLIISKDNNSSCI